MPAYFLEIVVLLLIASVARCSFHSLRSILPVNLRGHDHVGVLFAAFSVSRHSSAVGGALTDRFGRKGIIVFADRILLSTWRWV